MIDFVHFSDLHILPEIDGGFLDQRPAAKFREAVATVRRMERRPAFFVISGDLSHRGEPESYATLRELLRELDAFDVPVLLGLGNHDSRAAFRQVMLGEDGADDGRTYDHSAIIGGLQVIMLDTSRPGLVHGVLDDAQLAWLDGELGRPAPEGRIVVMHHPPAPNPVLALGDGFMLHGAERLGAVLRDRGVIALLSGHIHIATAMNFYGIPSITAPSVAYTVDPTSRDVINALDGSGFMVGHVRAGHAILGAVIQPGPQNVVHRYDPRDPEAVEKLRAAEGSGR